MTTPSFFSFFKSLKIALFAIDESWCISEWGRDFRPPYLQLGILKRVSWCSFNRFDGNGGKQTRNEILEKLKIPKENLFLSSFDRPNISYEIVEKNSPKDQLLSFLKQNSGESGIVYCMSRKKWKSWPHMAWGKGLKALPYHAGLDEFTRERNQETFLKEEEIIMVATVAFGMGIDKPNVRFVAHMDLPKSLGLITKKREGQGEMGFPQRAWMTYGSIVLFILRS